MSKVRGVVSHSSPGGRSFCEDHVIVNPGRGLIVVTDGFGGPIAGVEASRVAAESIRVFLEKEAGDLEATLPFVIKSYFSLAGNVLYNAVLYANKKINLWNAKKNVHEKGGASVIAGFLDGDLLAIAQTGVCSATLVRGGVVSTLAQPRTYSKIVDPRCTDPQKMGWDVPMIALGIGLDVEPEIFEVRVQAGDLIVFHSDGLAPEALEQWIASSSLSGSIPAPDQLRELISKHESWDNVACAAVYF